MDYTHSTTVALRPYQGECLTAIEEALARGVRRQLVVLPTGTGKTIVFSALIRQRSGRVIVLAHRDELIQQAVDKIRLVIPDAAVGVIKAERNELLFPITVASIQTISRESRLRQLPRDFRTAIIDEAHHAVAETYRKTIAALGGFKPDGPLIVGFTATADRGDQQ